MSLKDLSAQAVKRLEQSRLMKLGQDLIEARTTEEELVARVMFEKMVTNPTIH